MAEYIEREAALNAVTANKSSTELAWIAVAKIPAADVAPVVRCKDCIFREQLNSDYGGYYCCYTGKEIQLDDFCSKGDSMDGKE